MFIGGFGIVRLLVWGVFVFFIVMVGFALPPRSEENSRAQWCDEAKPPTHLASTPGDPGPRWRECRPAGRKG